MNGQKARYLGAMNSICVRALLSVSRFSLPAPSLSRPCRFVERPPSERRVRSGRVADEIERSRDEERSEWEGKAVQPKVANSHSLRRSSPLWLTSLLHSGKGKNGIYKQDRRERRRSGKTSIWKRCRRQDDGHQPELSTRCSSGLRRSRWLGRLAPWHAIFRNLLETIQRVLDVADGHLEYS